VPNVVPNVDAGGLGRGAASGVASPEATGNPFAPWAVSLSETFVAARGAGCDVDGFSGPWLELPGHPGVSALRSISRILLTCEGSRLFTSILLELSKRCNKRLVRRARNADWYKWSRYPLACRVI
jgi:hypothetical protein